METTKIELPPKQRNYWNNSDLARLTKFIAILINGQKSYGKEYSVKDTLAYYQLKLETRYTVNQVISGIDLYTNKKNDMPAPSDIIGILSPEKPEITAAEYYHAKSAWEKAGHPLFSEHLDTIKAFEKQTSEKVSRSREISENKDIQAIISNSIKRLQNPI